MAILEQQKQQKRQKILILVLIVVLIIAVFTWYSSLQEESTQEPVSVAGFSITEERLKEIKLDLSILDDPLFKSLKSHGLLPVVVEETGRENLFEPY